MLQHSRVLWYVDRYVELHNEVNDNQRLTRFRVGQLLLFPVYVAVVITVVAYVIPDDLPVLLSSIMMFVMAFLSTHVIGRIYGVIWTWNDQAQRDLGGSE